MRPSALAAPPLLVLLFVFLLLPALALPRLAHAWGGKGHRIVALLAEAELSPAARAEVARLLAGEAEPTLPGVANWADDLRDTDPLRGRQTARWHFINFPPGKCQYAPPRDCPDGQCVIAGINRHFLALSDRKRPDAERREALKFLVHFVGDVHQPLHASDKPDKGGNEFQVSYRGEGWNLHSTWDTLILRERDLSADRYATLLRAQTPLPRDPTLRSQTPAMDWALESCLLGTQGKLYPPKHVIDDVYLDGHRPLVEQQLRRAGSRLAAMLNYALK
jgi:hypothetical protein